MKFINIIDRATKLKELYIQNKYKYPFSNKETIIEKLNTQHFSDYNNEFHKDIFEFLDAFAFIIDYDEPIKHDKLIEFFQTALNNINQPLIIQLIKTLSTIIGIDKELHFKEYTHVNTEELLELYSYLPKEIIIEHSCDIINFNEINMQLTDFLLSPIPSTKPLKVTEEITGAIADTINITLNSICISVYMEKFYLNHSIEKTNIKRHLDTI